MMSNTNYGYLFGKDYYRGASYDIKDQERFFNAKHQPFFEDIFDFPETSPPPLTQFDLVTRYPGLTLGTGYGHGVKNVVGDFKIGFFFDHTTGLPVIPGSSIKGMLRSVFPCATGKHQHKNTSDEIKKAKRAYIRKLLAKDDLFNVDNLELEIFEGKDFCKKQGNGLIPVPLRDTFLDAEIVQGNGTGHIFGDDYITPHIDPESRKPAPLKNPIPLRFLKILPNVTFRFSFELHDGLITKEQKLTLFRQILLDQGVGAKTNVGYGRLK